MPQCMISRHNEINRWDQDLHNMVHDEAASGSPLDPNRDYENEYQHATARLSACNRALYSIYANYLDRPFHPYQAG